MLDDKDLSFKSEEECRRQMALLLEHVRGEIAVMQAMIDRLSKTVYGGNGGPGVLEKLEAKIDKIYEKTGERIQHVERFQYIAYGIFLAVQGLIVWGVLSLKGLIPK